MMQYKICDGQYVEASIGSVVCGLCYTARQKAALRTAPLRAHSRFAGLLCDLLFGKVRAFLRGGLVDMGFCIFMFSLFLSMSG